ncbi:FecR domain-containing protein [Brevundimonas sp. SORGH_AS_0993]|uniref:FecR family protein n=1 Tax=Brevundimonas sp. SORGH_AS_0993 TaxID=3041794 RepID=UPI002783452F|nr:FecR domain-containing protein [Brevundimonas sp. SORGH_AS_0993]MDQ1155662.1 transmembrane sensor [Brevundimonas sp. SORGH_AS_0993]
MDEPKSQDVDQTACLWAARLDDGPLPAADRTRLDAWLAADVRHLGAFARARAVAVHSRRAGGLAGGTPLRSLSLSSQPRGELNRRALIAACVPAALGGVGAWALLRQSADPFSTRKGETRVVPLDDGSVMTVNTLSAGVVRYGQSARTVVLKTGEALFNVVADVGRPFVVRSGDTTVMANGANFLVRRLGDQPVEVVSFGGDVEIKGDVGHRLKLAANTQAVVREGARPQSVGEVDADRELAWRRGRIQLENETLSQAALEFARYSDTPIVMADAGVADLRITGLFVANDPVAFAKAAAGSLDLKVDVNAEQIVLARV